MRPVVLTIAGSDSSGGAGIQADLKSIEAHGGRAATVITAVTAQGPRGVRHIHALPTQSVAAQLDAVFDDLAVAGVKTGMLVGAPIVELVARVLRERGVPIVVLDPVLRSTSGTELLDADGRQALIRDLLPLGTVVTPNADEAAQLTGITVERLADAERAGRALLSAGARAVLVKGGHLRPADRATDVLVEAAGVTLLRGEVVEGGEVRGTGCALASAIATLLARGRGLVEAVTLAKQHVAEALRRALREGGAAPAVDPHFAGGGRTGSG